MGNEWTLPIFELCILRVKAFNKGTRRFENLDNIDELNTFVWDWYNKGFTKFVVKSFDQDGFRKRRFISYGEDLYYEQNRLVKII